MIEHLYLSGLIMLLPFFMWQQKLEGRYYVAFIATGLMLIWWMIMGFPVVMDMPTILGACFVLWGAASLLWTHSRQSWFDLYAMGCGFVVFLTARSLPTETVLLMVLIPGLIFALVALYYYDHKILVHKDWLKRYCIFGNQNHLGCFYLMPLFASFWLCAHVSFWFCLASIFLILALAASECRGAQIGALVGSVLAAMAALSPWFGILFIVMAALAYVYWKMRPDSNWHRISIWMAAVLLIRKNPLCGYGLRTFRREYPGIIPELLRNRWTKHFFSRGLLVEDAISHRVHNDHLEIMVELGLIGYAIFLCFFSSLPWQATALLSGAVAAFAVHGLFFFPMKEAHTALPFWAVVGSMSGINAARMEVDPVFAVVIGLIICRLLYGLMIKTHGLWWYAQSTKIPVTANPETPEQHKLLRSKQMLLNEAIARDPYNNGYLTEGYYYHVFYEPGIAFQYASRCVENYDGGKTKWGIMDQYARAVVRLGGFNVARQALKYALYICPGFHQSVSLMEQLDTIEKGKMQDGQ